MLTRTSADWGSASGERSPQKVASVERPTHNVHASRQHCSPRWHACRPSHPVCTAEARAYQRQPRLVEAGVSASFAARRCPLRKRLLRTPAYMVTLSSPAVKRLTLPPLWEYHPRSQARFRDGNSSCQTARLWPELHLLRTGASPTAQNSLVECQC
jgi:hypothetical protein